MRALALEAEVISWDICPILFLFSFHLSFHLLSQCLHMHSMGRPYFIFIFALVYYFIHI